MSLTFIKNTRSPSTAASEIIDIDVTPIMNMFVILIPFLVSMAVFTHLTILEFSLPPNVGAGLDKSMGKPKLKITIVISDTYLAITHGELMLDSIGIVNDEYDYALFKEKLLLRRDGVDIKNEVVVAVGDRIKFKNVVTVMDRCREAGFEKVGLSSAPEKVETL